MTGKQLNRYPFVGKMDRVGSSQRTPIEGTPSVHLETAIS